jgi:hypothetical protein
MAVQSVRVLDHREGSLVAQERRHALPGIQTLRRLPRPYRWLAIWIRFPHVSSNTAVVTDCISSGS